MGRERYFTVVYNFTGESTIFNGSSSSGFGNIDFKTYDGQYINRRITNDMITEKLEKDFPSLKNFSVVVLNVVEMSEEDYKIWKCKDD